MGVIIVTNPDAHKETEKYLARQAEKLRAKEKEEQAKQNAKAAKTLKRQPIYDGQGSIPKTKNPPTAAFCGTGTAIAFHNYFAAQTNVRDVTAYGAGSQIHANDRHFAPDKNHIGQSVQMLDHVIRGSQVDGGVYPPNVKRTPPVKYDGLFDKKFENIHGLEQYTQRILQYGAEDIVNWRNSNPPSEKDRLCVSMPFKNPVGLGVRTQTGSNRLELVQTNTISWVLQCDKKQKVGIGSITIYADAAADMNYNGTAAYNKHKTKELHLDNDKLKPNVKAVDITQHDKPVSLTRLAHSTPVYQELKKGLAKGYQDYALRLGMVDYQASDVGKPFDGCDVPIVQLSTKDPDVISPDPMITVSFAPTKELKKNQKINEDIVAKYDRVVFEMGKMTIYSTNHSHELKDLNGCSIGEKEDQNCDQRIKICNFIQSRIEHYSGKELDVHTKHISNPDVIKNTQQKGEKAKNQLDDTAIRVIGE